MITVFSSNGELVVEPITGLVIKADSDYYGTNELKEVAPPAVERRVATAATAELCFRCQRAFNAGQSMVVVTPVEDPEMPVCYHEHCLTQGHSHASAGKVTYTSHAKWPTGVGINLGNTQNESTDTHGDKAAAEAVCQLLHERGFGGDGKVFPLQTWVTSDEEAHP